MTARVRRLVRPFAPELERLILAEDSTDPDVQRLDDLLGVLASYRDELAASSEARIAVAARVADASRRIEAFVAKMRTELPSPAELAEASAAFKASSLDPRDPTVEALGRAKDIRETTARLYTAFAAPEWSDAQVRETFLDWFRLDKDKLRATKTSAGDVAQAVKRFTKDVGEVSMFRWIHKRLATGEGQALLRAEIERSLQRGRPKAGTAQRRDTLEELMKFLFRVTPAASLQARRRSKKPSKK